MLITLSHTSGYFNVPLILQRTVLQTTVLENEVHIFHWNPNQSFSNISSERIWIWDSTVALIKVELMRLKK